ncbi:unnamed protein product [Parajaminaea phylloscopi]
MARFQPSSSSAAQTSAAEGEQGVAATDRQPLEASSAPAEDEPGSARPGGIQAISRADVHRITSGQVILDVRSAVKELVENSLDAGATSIEVRFKNFGLDSIEVVDNGTGIKQQDWASLALPHHTSKIAAFDDLADVLTFGFRGEALSSLCANAKVTVLTATQEEAPLGTLLEFGAGGRLKDSSKKLARQRGTTVIIEDLFKSLPVRRRELERNCKREYGKAQVLLQSYAIISKGVRWSSWNTGKSSPDTSAPSSSSASGKKTVALMTSSAQAQDYITKNFAALFGSHSSAHLQALDLNLAIESSRSKAAKRLSSLKGRSRSGTTGAKRRKIASEVPDEDDARSSSGDEERDEAGHATDGSNSGSEDDGAEDVEDDGKQTVLVKGIISRPTRGSGRTSADRQFLYVNGRPWENVRITRAFNDVYRQFNTNQVPMLVADFVIEAGRYDVNVSPDKRTIFLHEEQQLTEALKTALEDFFAPARQTLGVNSLGTSSMTQSKLDMAGAERRRPQDSNAVAVDELEEAFDADDDLDLRHDDTQGGEITSAVRRRDDETKVLDEDEGAADAAESHTPSEEPYEALQRQEHSTDRSCLPRSMGYQTAATTRTTEVARGAVRTAKDIQPRLSELMQRRTASSSSSAASSSSPMPRQESGARPENPSLALHSMLAHYRTVRSHTQTPTVEDLEYREESGDEEEIAEPSGDVAFESEVARSKDVSAGDRVHQEEQAADEDTVEMSASSDDRDAHFGLPHDHSSLEADEDRQKNLAALDSDAGCVSTPDDWEVKPSGILTQGGSLALDMDSLRARVQKCAASRHSGSAGSSQVQEDSAATAQAADLSAAGVENLDLQDAESRLERVISKDDFAEMDILGQFNLGFIVARRSSPQLDDLFIIDQHAADEKYNFETLQQHTKIRSQRLIHPRLLELSASDELVVSQHLEAIRHNGFELEVDEDAVAGSRVHLVSQPISKDTVFGVRDLEELLYQLRDVTPGSSKALAVRCSKARAMFASRACRKSVMIGTALNTRQMSSVVRHMGTIEQPWNCPHGRPTMRHLACLRSLRQSKSLDARRAAVDWSRLAHLSVS